MKNTTDQPENNQTDGSPSAASPQIQDYSVPIPAGPEAGDIGFLEILKKFSRYRFMILSTVTVATLLSIIAAMMMQPVYRSEVLLAPMETENSQSNWTALAAQFGRSASLAGIDLGGGSSKEQAIAILRSRSLAEEFISSENLLPILFGGRWDTVNERWNVDTPDDVPTVADGYRMFNNRIRTVTEHRKTGFVTLGIEWTDRRLAAQWANLFVTRLNQFLRSKDIAEAERSVAFLNKELEKSGVIELRQGIYRLIEAQVQAVMLANVREEYAFKILDPAVPADENASVRPRKGLIVFAGFVVSLFFVLFVAWIRIVFKDARAK